MSSPLRDLLKMLEHATYVDDYDIQGSEFTVCRICESASGAGVLWKPGWHQKWCPVPRLQRKYQDRGPRDREPRSNR